VRHGSIVQKSSASEAKFGASPWEALGEALSST
jgi:hypothetical protein